MSFSRFDVVTVPFPLNEEPAKNSKVKRKKPQKLRPALVISNYNEFLPSGHCVLAMITSSSHSSWPLDVALTAPEEAGLPKGCMVRMKIITLDAFLIKRRIGRLSDTDANKVRASLKKLIF